MDYQQTAILEAVEEFKAEFEAEFLPIEPDIDHLVTEDDTPVDNLPSEKQQRLLTEPLYSSWSRAEPFLAAANVGVYQSVYHNPIVPDVFLSLDVQTAENWWGKRHRAYFLWEFGKPPEVVIELVSNKVGHERDTKFTKYAHLGALYYVIYDPQQLLQKPSLLVYELHVGHYVLKNDSQFGELGLGLTLWTGEFEGRHDSWLRWCDSEGQLILTGAERAEQERQRAAQEYRRAEAAEAQVEQAKVEAKHERTRAMQAESQIEHERTRAAQAESQIEQERHRAAQAEAKAARLLAQLQTLGIDATE
jgi:Uma2 family endonuclease